MARKVDFEAIPDSIWRFYEDVYVGSGAGHILVLTSAGHDIRDTFAAARMGRLFPIPQFDRIVVEPSRPNLPPADSYIVIGNTKMYLASHQPETDKPTVPRAHPLRDRLERLARIACFEIMDVGGERCVRNLVTGEDFMPVSGEAPIDYGIVRRILYENTIILEGPHRLGTLGAAKMATSERALQWVWDALALLEDYHERDTLEILVETQFVPGSTAGFMTVDSVSIRPRLLVCRGNMVFDLAAGSGEWVDQGEWKFVLKMMKNEKWERVEAEGAETRIVLSADLTGLDPTVRELACRFLESKQKVPAAERGKLLEHLSAAYDRFAIRLIKQMPRGETFVRFPTGRRAPLQLVRAHFFVHLVLCRLLGTKLPIEEATLRKFFSEYTPAEERSFEQAFKQNIRGQMSNAFQRLLYGEDACANIGRDDDPPAYYLKLGTVPLYVKLRL